METYRGETIVSELATRRASEGRRHLSQVIKGE